MLRIKQLPAFNGVPASLASGATTTVTCKMDLGRRVHAVHLEFGSDGATNPGQGLGTKAGNGMIADIRLVLNGTVVRRMSAVELNELNTLMSDPSGSQLSVRTSGTAGVAAFRTYLTIYFAEIWRKGYVVVNGVAVPEASLFAWNLAGINAFTIEVDLIGRLTTGANGIIDTPVIAGTYEYDELTRQDIGIITKWSRQNLGLSSEIRDLATRSGSYQSIHLFPPNSGETTTPTTTNYVTSIKLTRNGEELRNDVNRFQNDDLLIGRGMNPTALVTTNATTKKNTGVYHIVFDYDDPINSDLQVAGVDELTLKPTFDAQPANGMIAISQITGPAFS